MAPRKIYVKSAKPIPKQASWGGETVGKLKIQLLGALSFAGEIGGELALTRKNKALLAALALAGSAGLSRERLAALFWPNSGEKQAHASLRQALAACRKGLGAYQDCLHTDGEIVALDGAMIAFDVAEFEAEGGTERALALYQGDLLDGIRLREEAFETWLLPMRERLRARAIASMSRGLESAGDAEHAVGLAARLLELEPSNEAAHRSLMRIYAAQGRDNAALKQFIVCREILEHQLGVKPDRETIALFDLIRGKRRRPPDTTGRTTEKPTLAVMPFENLSGAAAHEPFVDGMVESVLTSLAKVPDLFVIARNSSFTYKNAMVDVRRAGQELGVKYVVEGSVRMAGNRVRITARLLNCGDGKQIWADHFDGEMADVFDLQDRLALEIVTALEVNLTEGEQARLWSERSLNPRVYEAFQRAMSLYRNFARQTHLQARQILQEALSLDPDYTPALFLYGLVLVDEARYGWTVNREAAFKSALDVAERALAIDPSCGEAYIVISYARSFQRRHDQAVEAAERAVALRPNNTGVFHLSATAHIYAGNFETGRNYEEQARRLSPLDHAVSVVDLARAHYHLGAFAEARQLASYVLESQPRWLTAQTILLAAQWRLGEQDQARAVAATIIEGHEKFSVSRWSNGAPYRRQEDLAALMDPLLEAGLPA